MSLQGRLARVRGGVRPATRCVNRSGMVAARLILASVTASLVMAACSGDGSVEDGLLATTSQPLSVAEMDPLVHVTVSGAGEIDVETDYLPQVVCCEHGGAHPEALKAQAVMARTHLHFVYFESGKGTAEAPLSGTTRDQAYFCAQQASDACREAVTATAGQITAYARSDSDLVANVSFFVDGPRPACLADGACTCASPSPAARMTPDDHPQGCDCFTFASQGAANPAFVTYNWALEGDAVEGSAIGNVSHESNRGCASQNIQNCLAYAGWLYPDLLRMFYGKDIELRYADGRPVPSAESPDEHAPEAGGTSPKSASAGERVVHEPSSCVIGKVGPKRTAGGGGGASAVALFLALALVARARRGRDEGS
jgi:hypothetical protein